MPTENRHRLWAFGKPRIVKHMPRVKTTTVGFYALNGTSVLRAVESLHKERIVEVFEAVREQNPAGRILLVLDNFSSHNAEYTRIRAEELGITLVFLPIASPHLQPIDPVWGVLKRAISPISTESADDFRALVEGTFLELTHRLSFAVDWIDRFLEVNSLR
jgi:transposase